MIVVLCMPAEIPIFITINSMKKRRKTVISTIPSTQSYSVMGPVRQGSVKASLAGASRCMKAVAMMTPDPKNLQIKKTHSGILNPLCLIANMGKTAPSDDMIHIIKTAATRRPMRPS